MDVYVTPLVTVVMPAYNASKYISKAIESVLLQTFKNWELIIVDDGSTDDTLEIIKAYAIKDNRIKFDSIINSGGAKIPRDHAISLSNGEWIMSLDADDYFASDVIEMAIARQNATSADIVLIKMIQFENIDSIIRTIPDEFFDYNQVLVGKDVVKMTLCGWKVSASGALINKNILFDLSKKGDKVYVFSDEYDTRKYLIRAKYVAFCEVNYYYRQFEDSITHKISVKPFEILITNKMLENLIDENFDKSDETVYLIKRHRLSYIVYLRIDFLRNKKLLSKQDKIKISHLIRNSFLTIDRSVKYRLLFSILIMNYTTFKLLTSIYSILPKKYAIR